MFILYSIKASESDHLPIFLDPRFKQNLYRHKRFRFENVWLREPDCGEVVQRSWDNTAGQTVHQKIKVCGQDLFQCGGGGGGGGGGGAGGACAYQRVKN